MTTFPNPLIHEDQQDIVPQREETIVETSASEVSFIHPLHQVHCEASPLVSNARTNVTYPSWPTSRPGPMATLPPYGQHPHPLRQDQMVYECYDQEQGQACTSSIPISGQNESLIPISKQEMIAEREARERWADDGGIQVH